jgi:hypothetical protein
MRQRTTAAFLAAVITISGLAFGTAAPAAADKEKTYRIGTYLGSAATIYALAKGEGTWAVVGGAATLLSYSQWKKEAERRRKRDRSRSAYRAYRTRWLQQHRGRRIVRR